MRISDWSSDVCSSDLFSIPVMSLKEKRWTNVVRQQYDFSCGSAAVATLLTYHYEMPTDEARAFEEMFVRGDQAKIQAEGFSMLDIKQFLDRDRKSTRMNSSH